jgi:hypothetical protein
MTQMVLKVIARTTKGHWVEIGDDHLATLMGSQPADHAEGGLVIYQHCESSGKVPIVYKIDDPMVFALRAEYLVGAMRPLIRRLKELSLKDEGSTYDHALHAHAELSDFASGLKWAAQCTKPKEKKK